MVNQHPEWHERSRASESRRHQGRAGWREKALTGVMATHAGIELRRIHPAVEDGWQRRESEINRPTPSCYQPMLNASSTCELRSRHSCSGGAPSVSAFCRKQLWVRLSKFAQHLKTKLNCRAGKPFIVRLRAIDVVETRPGQPVGIARSIWKAAQIMALAIRRRFARCGPIHTGSPGAPLPVSCPSYRRGNVHTAIDRNLLSEN